MPTTLNKLSEQVWRIVKGGTPSDDTELTLREVRELVTQVLNRKLKAEQLTVHQAYGEHFPPHHLLATYDGIAVGSVATPVQSIECTEMEDLVVTSVQMSIQHVGDDPDYFYIEITGVKFSDFSGVTGADIEALIADASDSCAVTFTTTDVGPVSFIIAGIEDFTVDGTTITFFYYPDAVPDTGYWTTGDGLYWVTDDGLYWTTPTDGSGTTLPTVLEEYVEYSHFYLDSVLLGTTETFNYNFTMISICCIATDEADIDAYADLPAMPITLPRGMGIWRVYRASNPNAPFIPLSSQVTSIAENVTHTNLSSILGAMTAYEWMSATRIRFNQPASVIGSTVSMQLLVTDYRSAPDDLLPIPADMEDVVIKETLDLLRIQPPLDKNNDENDQR